MPSPVDQARSFGAVSLLYDKVRPGYPPAAVGSLLPDGARSVVEVGAGTGKLTGALVERGLEVIAVEPDEAMRRLLAARAPGADIRDGTAEALPVDDQSADAVLFAQSWHWVDVPAASAEAARVLRPGGHLGLLWNLSDDRVSWAAELLRLTGSQASYLGSRGREDVPGFGEGRRRDFPWEHRLGHDEFIELIQTWSSVSTRAEAERLGVVRRVEELIAEALGPGQDVITLPQVCVAVSHRPLSEGCSPPGR
jgi:SAM-dependent methyltransferase